MHETNGEHSDNGSVCANGAVVFERVKLQKNPTGGS